MKALCFVCLFVFAYNKPYKLEIISISLFFHIFFKIKSCDESNLGTQLTKFLKKNNNPGMITIYFFFIYIQNYLKGSLPLTAGTLISLVVQQNPRSLRIIISPGIEPFRPLQTLLYNLHHAGK